MESLLFITKPLDIKDSNIKKERTKFVLSRS